MHTCNRDAGSHATHNLAFETTMRQDGIDLGLVSDLPYPEARRSVNGKVGDYHELVANEALNPGSFCL